MRRLLSRSVFPVFIICVLLAALGCPDTAGDDDATPADDDDSASAGDDDDATPGDDDDDDDDATPGDDDSAGDDDDSAAGDDDVELDPCSGLDVPGEYECDDCPDLELPGGYAFEIQLDDAGTWRFHSGDTGPVTGNDGDGSWYLTRTGSTPGENQGPISTVGNGTFDALMPVFCDTQLMKGAWSNDSGTYCVVHELDNANCTEADIRITITWESGVFDLELHLIRDGGQINNHDGGIDDCTWTNMDPDWGVPGDPADNPHKDVDDTGDNGVENIYLPNPENVLYHVMVEYWASGDPSTPQTVFNVDGDTRVSTIQDFMPREVWYVGTIDWPNRTITVLDDVIDCSADWSSGCLMDIP